MLRDSRNLFLYDDVATIWRDKYIRRQPTIMKGNLLCSVRSQVLHKQLIGTPLAVRQQIRRMFIRDHEALSSLSLAQKSLGTRAR